PYAHDTIGSMADLDAASLQTVKDWFRDHYGPNNAVLVLAGDIDVAAAKPLVEKYFGAIKAGPKSKLPVAPVTALPAPVTETIKDRVAAVALTRNWAVPGLNDPESASLEVAAAVLGGLSSSRMNNQLVRKEKLFTEVGVDNSAFAQVGTFGVFGLVRPGVDPVAAGKRLDAVIAEFLAEGPTQDEVSRVVTSTVARRIRGLESVGGFGGKAVALAEGALYSNDPGFYKKQLAALAAQTPASVKAAAGKWLTRPVLTVNVVQGARDAYEEAQVPAQKTVVAAPEQAPKGTRGALPAVGEVAGLSFPTVSRALLANGIEVIYAQRDAVPVTQAVISFDAGRAADPADRLGTQQLTLDMLDEGTKKLDSIAFAEAKERIGAQIGTGASPDRTTVSLVVPSANLAPGLDLFADVTRNPAFAESEVARLKNQQLAQIAQELTDPQGLVQRVLPAYLYGPSSPYGKPGGSGDPKVVAALGRADLLAFQQAWLRPDKAKIFVVSDRPLAEVTAALDARFGDWKGVGAAGSKRFATPAPAAAAKIVLIDRPDSPQSLIAGGLPTALKGTDELLPITIANDALGGSFLGRINMNLREDKHWSYGVRGAFNRNEFAAPYSISAPVQADQTGPSLAELRREVGEFVGTKPMTQAEFDRAITGAVRSVAGQFETSGAVLGAMQQNDLYRRPDDYYATITQRYRALTLPGVQGAMKAAIQPATTTWVVVGDAAKVRPQLDRLGLPVEVVPAASVTGAR
ncbi:MAG TPA: insulinase family protein, partial [Sphingomonas sp.]|nr:insulinase family protein [Sphingomonas sp.]